MQKPELLQDNLQENLHSFRTDTLQLLIYIAQAVGIGGMFLFMARLNLGTEQIEREAISLAWFILMVALTWFAQREDKFDQAHRFFFLAILGGPFIALVLLEDFRTFMAYVLVVPVVLAGVLGNPLAPFRIAAINISLFLMLGVLHLLGWYTEASFVTFGSYVGFFFGPAFLQILGALISWFATRDLVSTVEWAMESNRLAERRADRLHGSEQRVARTLLELEGAYDVQKRLNDQLHLLNEELAKARHMADEANTLKTRFLANMSHELRTPLNAIINFTQFMSKPRYGELTARQTELQERVLVNSEHLLGLINDILDLSKIEAGRMELQLEEIDLQPIISGVMATAVGLTKSKGLSLATDVEPDLPWVRGDKIRVRQILLNLISNAAKFTDEGGLTLRAFECESLVQISVEDTGSGIPAEELPLVFEEFHQVEQAASSQRQQGTGLGLPISRHLVLLQGGTMWVESSPGEGSVFHFTLPIATPAATATPEVIVFDPEAQPAS